MVGEDSAANVRIETFDDIADGLRLLREEAGAISYAEIARRIAARRLAAGVAAAAAQPARTTIYDAFARGRSRLSPQLVREIVVALEVSDEEADRWEERCRRARKIAPMAASAAVGDEAAPSADASSAVAISTPTTASPTLSPAFRRRLTWQQLTGLMLVCLIGNLLGHGVVHWFGLPLYLDMVGTAVVSLMAGPWWGAVVAIASQGAAVGVNSPAAIPFVLVTIAGALIWGFGARRVRSLPQFFLLNVIAGCVCTVVAVPILVVLFGGLTGHSADSMTLDFMGSGENPIAAVLTSNLITSLADKVITGFIALTVIGSLRPWMPVPNMPIFDATSPDAEFLPASPARR